MAPWAMPVMVARSRVRRSRRLSPRWRLGMVAFPLVSGFACASADVFSTVEAAMRGAAGCAGMRPWAAQRHVAAGVPVGGEG